MRACVRALSIFRDTSTWAGGDDDDDDDDDDVAMLRGRNNKARPPLACSSRCLGHPLLAWGRPLDERGRRCIIYEVRT